MKKMSRSKAIMSILLIGLAALIIGGATMSWFTDSDTVKDATFTAGTIEVSADGPKHGLSEIELSKINPGDCDRVEWTIRNKGTKNAELRVSLSALWKNIDKSDGSGYDPSVDPFYFYPLPDSGWEMVEEGGEIWLYYTGGPVQGSVDGDGVGGNVPLILVVGFDGPEMNNAYQSAIMTIGGKVEAIQATHDAADEVWGPILGELRDGTYDLSGLALTNFNYFDTGRGANMDCWPGGGNNDDDDGDDPVVVGNFEIKCVTATGYDPNGPNNEYTKVSGTIWKLKDTNGNPITTPQSVQVVAKVDVMWDGVPEKSKTEQLTIDFDENGEGSFSVDVLGIDTNWDSSATVTITIGSVTKSASGIGY